MSTPSSTTEGSWAPDSLAKVGRMSRVLANSCVTPEENAHLLKPDVFEQTVVNKTVLTRLDNS